MFCERFSCCLLNFTLVYGNFSYNIKYKEKDKKMELQTKIVENGIELGTIENGRIFTNGVDVYTLGRLYTLLSKTTQETQPNPGDEYQGGIYVGEFDGKRYVVSKDEVKLNHKDAKEWCRNYRKDGYDDWFLPNKDELDFLFESNVIENPSIWYWSSTEYNSTDAWFQYFLTSCAGPQSTGTVLNTFCVRGLRVVN